jgi:hypothetical protein
MVVTGRRDPAGVHLDASLSVVGMVAVVRTTVHPPSGGEGRGFELVDRLVIDLRDSELAVLPTDLVLRTAPGELVIVCPAPAEQRRIMGIVDEIRAVVVARQGPTGVPPKLSISVAFAGGGSG